MVNTRVEAAQWTCTIRAMQSGDDRYAAAAPVERSFVYTKAPMQLVVENSPALVGAGPHAIVTRVRFVDSTAMSGLTSLGHLLTAQVLTANTCRINSHGVWDRTGGIVNRTYLVGLANGTCSLKLDFAGTIDRAPVSLTWNATITMPVETATYVEAQVGGTTVAATGYTVSKTSAVGGQLTIDFTVRAQDTKLAPAANAGRLATSGALRTTFPTPGVCSLRSASNISGNIFRVVLRLNAEGTCSVQASFLGVRSMLYLPSALNWSATVTK
jgi:hypothetical protein